MKHWCIKTIFKMYVHLSHIRIKKHKKIKNKKTKQTNNKPKIVYLFDRIILPELFLFFCSDEAMLANMWMAYISQKAKDSSCSGNPIGLKTLILIFHTTMIHNWLEMHVFVNDFNHFFFWGGGDISIIINY